MYNKRTTIKEIARAAGVSIQTVSRVINNRPDVAAGTRDQVQKIIDEQGYTPNNVARSLSRKRTNTIAVVIAGLKFTGPSKTLNGIAEAAEDMNYTLVVKQLQQFEHNAQPVLDWLLARQVDGIIWAVPEFGHNRAWLDEWLPQLPIPIVFHDMAARPDASIIYMDNYAGAKKATQHLLRQGYRAVGHISGPLEWWAADQRKLGWQDALEEEGIPFEERFWVQGDWSLSRGVSLISYLLDQYPEMDAVFAANDQMAVGALQTLARRSIKVPDTLAVVGYDDIPEAAYVWPPLTTIRQDFFRYGYSSVSELVKLIEAYQSERSVIDHHSMVIEPELIVRESSSMSKNRR